MAGNEDDDVTPEARISLEQVFEARSIEARETFDWKVAVLVALKVSERATYEADDEYTAMLRFRDSLNSALRFKVEARPRSKNDQSRRAASELRSYDWIIKNFNDLSTFQRRLLEERAKARGIEPPTEAELKDPAQRRAAALSLRSLIRLSFEDRSAVTNDGRSENSDPRLSELLYVRRPKSKTVQKHDEVRLFTGQIAHLWDEAGLSPNGSKGALAKSNREAPTDFMMFLEGALKAAFPRAKIDVVNLVNSLVSTPPLKT